MAGKRSKATEVEEFYIRFNPKGLTQEELSNKFELSVKTIAGIQQRHREELERLEQEELENKVDVEIEAQPEEKSMTRLMFEQNSRKGRTMILTEGISERLDETRKISKNNQKKSKYDNGHITKTYK